MLPSSIYISPRFEVCPHAVFCTCFGITIVTKFQKDFKRIEIIMGFHQFGCIRIHCWAIYTINAFLNITPVSHSGINVQIYQVCLIVFALLLVLESNLLLGF